MARTTPEGEIKKLVKSFLDEYSINYRMIVPSAYGRGTGISDFLCWPKGVLVAVETKKRTDKKGPTPNQQEFLDEINACGGLGVVVKCEQDILDLEAQLKQRGLI